MVHASLEIPINTWLDELADWSNRKRSKKYRAEKDGYISGMEKNFKPIAESASVKLTEANVLSENNSAVASSSKSLEPSLAAEEAPHGTSKCSKSSSTSKSQFDRFFDQFGLWILVLIACFVTSGFDLHPLSIPRQADKSCLLKKIENSVGVKSPSDPCGLTSL